MCGLTAIYQRIMNHHKRTIIVDESNPCKHSFYLQLMLHLEQIRAKVEMVKI